SLSNQRQIVFLAFILVCSLCSCVVGLRQVHANPGPLRLPSPTMRRLALAILGTVLGASRVSAHPAPFSYVDVTIGERQVDVALVAHTFDVAHELAAQPPELLLDPKQLAARGDEIVARLLPRLGLVADGHALSCRPSTTPEALPDRSAVRLRLACDADGPAGVLQVRAALFPYD